jgi:hypothetical protein
MSTDALVARLKARVAALEERVEGAAELTELVNQNALPNRTPAAYVLPLGLRAGQADAATGLFRQAIGELVGVLLIIRSAGDVTGQRALPTMHSLVADVVNAVCGWGPDGNVVGGVFQLSRGALVSLNRGTIIYQLDFAVDDMLRIS